MSTAAPTRGIAIAAILGLRSRQRQRSRNSSVSRLKAKPRPVADQCRRSTLWPTSTRQGAGSRPAKQPEARCRLLRATASLRQCRPGPNPKPPKGHGETGNRPKTVVRQRGARGIREDRPGPRSRTSASPTVAYKLVEERNLERKKARAEASASPWARGRLGGWLLPPGVSSRALHIEVRFARRYGRR